MAMVVVKACIVLFVLTVLFSQGLVHARHRNRTLNNNYTYIYHDYYMRAAEGDTIHLCANLSEPQTDPFYLYYYSYYYTTEVNEDYNYLDNYLVFQPGETRKCIELDIYDDDIAGEEDLEAFEVKWASFDDNIVFYDYYYDINGTSYSYSLVPIEDNDVLIITPNTTKIEVHEGDYEYICVTSDQEARDTDALFFADFEDGTADIHYDLKYDHETYPSFDQYGGYYYIEEGYNYTCFHFHTEDDNEFEGNEQFTIKLHPFTPDPFPPPNGTCRCRGGFVDRNGNPRPYLPENGLFNTAIAEGQDVITVTILDDEEPPCPQTGGPFCKELIKGIACDYLRGKASSEDDLVRVCKDGLLPRLRRWNKTY